jgi:hypothetical protein
MILQLYAPVEFTDACRIVVPLEAPSTSGSILVAAVSMNGRGAGLRVSDNLGASTSRWRESNSSQGSSIWYRIQSPQPGVTQIVFETTNAATITGRVLVVESAGVAVGVALQSLADLLVEAQLAAPLP